MKFDNDDISTLAAALAPFIRQAVSDQYGDVLTAAQQPEVMSTERAAKYLDVDVQSIRRAAKSGQLPGHKVDKKYRFLRSDLLSAFKIQSDESSSLPFSAEALAAAPNN